MSIGDPIDGVFRARRLSGAGALRLSFVCGLLLICGCATRPYRFSQFHDPRPDASSSDVVEIGRGQPHRFLDALGNIAGIKSKILPFNSEMNNHRVTDATLNQLVEYLEKNDITDVYVSVNEYAPRDQWRRMRENDRIAPGWKYTLGTLSWLDYTILPKRVFGGDRYNPYTNSLYVNSNLPAVLITEAAYAKDIHSRKYPGAYAFFVNDMPVLAIWRRCRAVNEVLGYAQSQGDWVLEKQTYQVVYPQIGAATFGEAGLAATGPIAGVSAIFVGPIMEVGGACVGHAVGRSMASYRQRQVDRDEEEVRLAKLFDHDESTPGFSSNSESETRHTGETTGSLNDKITPVRHVDDFETANPPRRRQSPERQ